MKIAIIGYGQMGKLIERLATEQKIEVVSIIDPNLEKVIDAESLKDADVCIDFSLPDAVLKNCKQIAKLKKNIVIGTTGWSEHLNEISQIAQDNNIGIIYGSNFSIGMNTFFHIVANAAELINQIDNYDLFGYEMHHNKKVDSPSGTAKTLAEIVLDKVDRKETAQYDKLDRKIDDEEFHLASIRSGDIPGTHVIGFDSSADTIELKHTARSRDGFALGAISAAKWIEHKTGIYNFQDIFFQMLMG